MTASGTELASTDGDDDLELGPQPGGERRTGLGQQQDGQGQGQQWLALGQAAVGGDVVVAVAGPTEDGDDGERADDHERVGEEVVQGGADALGRRGLQPQQHETGVVDRRVRQHALDVALDDGQPGPEQEGDDGDGVDDRLPVGVQRAEGRDEHPQQRGEPADLGHRGHEARDRRGRALVDVGRPHVERDGRHLEGEADQQQPQAGQAAARPTPARCATGSRRSGRGSSTRSRRTSSAMP